jgi:AraC-like DNA-binding protein
MKFVNSSNRGDPSDIKQVLFPLHLQIWCCRFWQLSQWECNEMSFPYWRLYWNKTSKGEISYLDQSFLMDSNSIFLIPPFTPFDTHIAGHKRMTEGINVAGSRIDKAQDEEELAKDRLLHLFIHFNMGVPYDRVLPGIYKIEINQEQQNRLKKVTDFLKTENVNFSLNLNLYLHSIITEHIAHLKEELWLTTIIDNRIIDIIRLIEKELDKNPSNEDLAKYINMATNSFIRLFQKEMHLSPQYYIIRQKIDRACLLLLHSDLKIDNIAWSLGFSDRYHFSKVFKKVVLKSPADYRKGSMII